MFFFKQLLRPLIEVDKSTNKIQVKQMDYKVLQKLDNQYQLQ